MLDPSTVLNFPEPARLPSTYTAELEPLVVRSFSPVAEYGTFEVRPFLCSAFVSNDLLASRVRSMYREGTMAFLA